MEEEKKEENRIALSSYTKAFLERYFKIKKKASPDELSRINVSQTVSFFALAYEKVRNAVEYRESHLIRRSAIERILKRRLAMNPDGEGEAENTIRELLWARYFPADSLGEDDIDHVQKVLDRYKKFRTGLLPGRPSEQKGFLAQFTIDLLTCEIEEVLTPYEAKRQEMETYFVYQVLKDKIRIEGLSEEDKNAYFYVSLEQALSKSDLAYLRFHLFRLTHSPISEATDQELERLVAEFPGVAKTIDQYIKNPYSERILRYVRRQMPPFRVLFELLKKEGEEASKTLSDPKKLQMAVDAICREKYAGTAIRLRNLGIRAIIYIFLTKMLFALALEYPLSQWLYGEVSYFSLSINTLFPPLLMFLIIGLTRVPGEDNTRRIYERLINIVDTDQSYETSVSFAIRARRVRKQARIFVFTVFYTSTFIFTFTLLYLLLNMLGFNAVSKAVFVFFVSLVTFFAHRITQVAREYKLREREGIFVPLLDIFFLPILSLGKFLSRGIARLNIFTVLFDFFIEAPFKLIFEVLEEWISFVRARKDEIV